MRQAIEKYGFPYPVGLSMGDIDEISEALGSIKSSITNLVDGHKITLDKLAVINDKVTQQGTESILAKAQMDAMHKRMDRIEPLVDDHADKFKFMAWLVAGITSGVTLLINWAAPFMGKLFP